MFLSKLEVYDDNELEDYARVALMRANIFIFFLERNDIWLEKLWPYKTSTKIKENPRHNIQSRQSQSHTNQNNRNSNVTYNPKFWLPPRIKTTSITS